MTSIKMMLNGKATEVDTGSDTPLLCVLRGTLQAAGTKFGCGVALCGANMVHLDGYCCFHGSARPKIDDVHARN